SVSAARIYVLNDLFVAPAHRRQGVARRLLEAAHRVGSDGGAVYLALSTARDNRPAQALCESLGWVRDEAFHQYTLATGATSAGLARRPRPEDSWRHGSGRRVMAGRTWGAYFSVVTVVLLVLGVVAFSDNLFTNITQPSNRDPKFVVHGLFGLAWYVLLATQANLVRQCNLRLHRKLGIATFVVAI